MIQTRNGFRATPSYLMLDSVKFAVLPTASRSFYEAEARFSALHKTLEIKFPSSLVLGQFLSVLRQEKQS
jgi:hypothetical protein